VNTRMLETISVSGEKVRISHGDFGYKSATDLHKRHVFNGIGWHAGLTIPCPWKTASKHCAGGQDGAAFVATAKLPGSQRPPAAFSSNQHHSH
jgi:hypothetical protein